MPRLCSLFLGGHLSRWLTKHRPSSTWSANSYGCYNGFIPRKRIKIGCMSTLIKMESGDNIELEEFINQISCSVKNMDTERLYQAYSQLAQSNFASGISVRHRMRLLRRISRYEPDVIICTARVDKIAQDLAAVSGGIPSGAWKFVLLGKLRRGNLMEFEKAWEALRNGTYNNLWSSSNIKDEGIKDKGEMEGSAWNIRIRAWSMAGHHLRAADMLNDMHVEGVLVTASTYHLVAVEYARAGRVDLAEKTLEKMKAAGFRQSSEAWRAIVRAKFNSGDPEGAWRAAQRLLEDGRRDLVATWNTLLEGYLEHNPKLTIDVWNEMRQRGVKYDLASWNIYLKAILYELKGKKEEESEKKIIEFLSGMEKECPPGVYTFGIILNWCKLQTLFSLADRIYLLLQSRWKKVPNLVLLNTMMDIAVNYKDSEQAVVEILGEYDRLQVKKNQVTYSTMTKANSTKEATDKMILNPWTFDIFLKAMKKREGESTDIASKLLKQLYQNGFVPNIVTLTSIISNYAKKGQIRLADELYCQALEMNLKPDVHLLSALMDAHVRRRDLAQARYIFEEMRRHGIIANHVTYTSLAKAYANRGDIENMDKIFREMVLLGNEMSVKSWTIRADAYAKRGCMQEAMRILRTAKRQNKVDSRLYLVVVRGFLEKGEIKVAELLRRDMRQQGLKDDLTWYSSLLRHLKGDERQLILNFAAGGIITTKTHSDLEEMKEGDIREWNILLSWLMKQPSGLELAFLVFGSMAQRGSLIVGLVSEKAPSPNAATMRIVLGGCIRHGNWRRAESVWQWGSQSFATDPVLLAMSQSILKSSD